MIRVTVPAVADIPAGLSAVGVPIHASADGPVAVVDSADLPGVALPESLYPERFVKDGQLDSKYSIVVAGKNFGCGSSREHAPIALGSAGCKIVLAESFARIFFRNSVATGELYPCEITERLCDTLKNGDMVTVDLNAAAVTVKATGKVFKFKPLGDVRPVVDAGGLFNYARKSGMIPAQK